MTPELLTRADVIDYLRLNTDERNPDERLRNLIRRQGLPFIRRGRLYLFRKSAIDNWLDGHRGNYPVVERAECRPVKISPQERIA